jgi:hypothetical protein
MASLDLNQGEWHVVHDRHDFCRNFDIGMNTTHLPCVRTRGSVRHSPVCYLSTLTQAVNWPSLSIIAE